MNRYDIQRRDYQHMGHTPQRVYATLRQGKLINCALHAHKRHPHMPRPLTTQR